jgi:hypothetical protein
MRRLEFIALVSGATIILPKRISMFDPSKQKGK